MKYVQFANGEPGGARTRDHRIKSAMLYQLSYRPGGNFQYTIESLLSQSARTLNMVPEHRRIASRLAI
jgi:hypothetical protein